MTVTTRTCARAALVIAGCALGGVASAQYKSIDPEGITTYSDQPPPPTSRIIAEKKANAILSSTVVLPFEVRNAASKYPVTLYTGDSCSPCNDARTYLRNRGIPFAEKTVTSDDDIASFRQQSPDGTAPLIVVGSRKLVGFSQASLSGVLDSAGYPAANTLPRDYQNPDPTPLAANTRTTGQSVATQPAASTARPAAATPAPAPGSTGTPPGFRF